MAAPIFVVDGAREHAHLVRGGVPGATFIDGGALSPERLATLRAQATVRSIYIVDGKDPGEPHATDGIDDLVIVGAQHGPLHAACARLSPTATRAHRVDPTDTASIERLGRVLTGRGIGVVLGGGGARTFAHMGVLAAIRDAGVPIDFIGGCSGGAIFAALHALGWSVPRMRAAVWDHFVARGRPISPTIPLLSLISERPFLRILDSLFADAGISDMPIPYFCVSTNLTRGELVVHRKGLVRDAIRASMSVPGLAPPHVENGEIFVDGCVLDAMPVATMRALGAGVVIGIDVSARRGPSVAPHLNRMPSLWDLVKERMGGQRLQSAVVFWWDVMLSSALLGARRDDAAADLVIRPVLDGSGFLDFHRMDDFSATSYRAVRAALRSAPFGDDGAESPSPTTPNPDKALGRRA